MTMYRDLFLVHVHTNCTVPWPVFGLFFTFNSRIFVIFSFPVLFYILEVTESLRQKSIDDSLCYIMFDIPQLEFTL